MNKTPSSKAPTVLTRIFINAEGDLVVTDLWEDVEKVLGPDFTAASSGESCELGSQSESH